MQDNTDEKIRSLALDKKLQKPQEAVTSESLPRNVSMRLYELMNRVVSDEVNPSTVNAACNCASEIHKILKLNFEMARRGD